MLKKHNDILFPVIEKHDGVVIKTIGDAVMATFSTPLAAVKAASEIQNGLYQHNFKAGVGDKIRVKIGINTGDTLMDGGDVFGDAVNVAARIQSKAKEDQILVSKNVYEAVCGSDKILCRLHQKVQVKGKAESLLLYMVVWKDEDVVPEVEPKARAGGSKEKTIDFSQKAPGKSKWPWILVAVGMILIAFILLFGYPSFLRKGTIEYESPSPITTTAPLTRP